ncbi:MAG: BMP family protein [Armatimonadota bacterium]
MNGRVWERRSVLRLGLAGIAAALTSGCSGEGSPEAAGGGLKLGMVTDAGGVGDLSFNYMASLGLERAKQELGAEILIIESRQPSDYERNLQRAAERGCAVVFAIGFALEDSLKKVAPQYRDVHFGIVDADGPSEPNVTGIRFREEEGAFLVGALAGGMTRTGTIGFVGGMEIPLIKRFEAGYRAGLRTTRPDGSVLAKYTNNWEEVDKGRELALTLFSQNADIIFHGAGRCGLGVIEAARSRGPGYWAIGVDADQDRLGTADPENPQPPSRVLTSMLKRVDNAVFTLCQEAAQGKLEPGVRTFGVKEEGVGLTEMKYSRAEVPEELLKRVQELETLIREDKLDPPTTLEELEAWNPPSAA